MSEPFQPVVLDTNAICALFDSKKAEHQDAVEALARLLKARAEEEDDSLDPIFIIPSLVVYEVKRGLLWRQNKRLLRRVNDVLRLYAYIEPFDVAAAEQAAEEWARRAVAGRPAGELDLLIWATANSVDENIVSADKGFPEAQGVRKLRWDQVQR